MNIGNLFINLDTCVTNDALTEVTCLGKDGDYYKFPIPKKVDVKDCDPCVVKAINKKLLLRSL